MNKDKDKVDSKARVSLSPLVTAASCPIPLPTQLAEIGLVISSVAAKQSSWNGRLRLNRNARVNEMKDA